MPDFLPLPDRPKVVLLLVAYRQEAFVGEAARAALAQTYSPLEIIFSDDSSPDDTFHVMEELCREYRGPHRVTCRRNERNLGLIPHINLLNSEVDAELIVVAAGDDCSMPDRVSRIVDAYDASGRKANYIFSLVRGMSTDGELGGTFQSPGWVARGSKWRAGLQSFPVSIGAAQAWTKKMVDRFGPMQPYVWAEDQILGFRGVLLGPVEFIDEPLVNYRTGGLTNNAKAPRLGRYLKNQINGIGIYRQRARDARLAGESLLATVIWLKWFNMIIFFPLSPLFTLLRRRTARARRRAATW